MGRARRRVALRPQADRDIDHQFEYLAIEAGTHTAQRFLSALRMTLSALRVNPEIGSPRQFEDERLAGLRVWPVKGFRRQLVFYIPTRFTVEVVRVLNAARDVDAILNG